MLNFKLFEYLSLNPGDDVKLVRKNKVAKFVKWNDINRKFVKVEYPDGEIDIVKSMDIEKIENPEADVYETKDIEKLLQELDNIISYDIDTLPNTKRIIKVWHRLKDDPNRGDRPAHHTPFYNFTKNDPLFNTYFVIETLEDNNFKFNLYWGLVDNKLGNIETEYDGLELDYEQIKEVIIEYITFSLKLRIDGIEMLLKDIHQETNRFKLTRTYKNMEEKGEKFKNITPRSMYDYEPKATNTRKI